MISECALLLFGLSKHILNNKQYNEVHPAVGIECKETPIGHSVINYFKNSENNNSLYIAKRNNIKNSFYYDVGLVTGYSNYQILPISRLIYSEETFEIFVSPGIENNKTIIITGVQFKISF